jgi:hypothetical protein
MAQLERLHQRHATTHLRRRQLHDWRFAYGVSGCAGENRGRQQSCAYFTSGDHGFDLLLSPVRAIRAALMRINEASVGSGRLASFLAGKKVR